MAARKATWPPNSATVVCVNTHIHVEARGLYPVSHSSLKLLVCLDWQPGSPQGLPVSPSWLWDYR